jgi:anti-sigma factor RsiW
MKMVDTIDENMQFDLLALADGQLDGDPCHKARVEKAVARSPELSDRLRDYRLQAEALRRAFDPCLAEPIPQRLSDALEGSGSRRPRAARAIAAAILAVVACGAGWTAGRLTPSDTATWMTQAIDLTAPASVQKAGTPTGIAAGTGTPRTPLPDWLVAEVSPRMETPDLSPLGFDLIGLGTVESAAGRVLRLDYQATDGRVINLFLRRRWRQQETSIQMKEENGVTITSWMEGPLATAVAGPISRTQAIAVARAVRNALSNRYADAPSSKPPVLTQEGPTTVSIPDNTPSAPFIGLPAGRQPISRTQFPDSLDGSRSE